MPIVREFYANANEHHNGSGFAHGKFVPFTVDDINDYFEIPNDVIDEYFTLKPDYKEIINYLCKGNREWKIFKGLPVSIKSNKLHGAYKCWFYFIIARLFLVKHRVGVEWGSREELFYLKGPIDDGIMEKYVQQESSTAGGNSSIVRPKHHVLRFCPSRKEWSDLNLHGPSCVVL
ncbi:Uncharacterized protein TCM_013114 [Theobroma cacao]|uniref:Putative plant transposon protein domain-containing protein n=1 Tax=Theobroma cacao TaxID=3641 RepID=A0A061FX89_THECC|nr:Uncharacterized protein TCM_013114 [Theobroma cacao]